MDTREAVVNKLGWNLGLQGLNHTLRFVIWLVLARHLVPQEFGLLGMVLVVTGLVSVLAEFGFNAALVQSACITQVHMCSVFWINVCLGVALTIAVTGCAPLLGSFYGEPVLRYMTPVVALTFAISSCGSMSRTMLCRRMAFRKLGLIEVAATLGAGFVSIAMAALGAGVWSLVTQCVVLSVLTSVGYLAASGFRPRFVFDRRAVAELLRYSLNLQGFNIINYIANSMDKVLVGRFMGAGALGTYTRAYATMQFSEYQLTLMVSQVAWPALARMQDQPARMRLMYLQFLSFAAFLTFPLLLGLLAVADHFVLGLYGPQWAPVIPVLQILCVLGLFRIVIGSTGWVFLSLGRTDLQLYLGIAATTLLATGYGLGVWIGTIEAMALSSLVCGGLLLLFPAVLLGGRLIQLRVRDTLWAVTGPLVCAVAMAVVVRGVDGLLPKELTHTVKLAIEAGVGAGLYVLCAHASGLEPWRQLLCRLRWYRQSGRVSI